MRLKVTALILALLLATAAPALAQKTPGVTDTEIAIGLTTPLSGVAAAWGNTAVAMEAWAEHVNAQSGNHGRQPKVTGKNDGHVPRPAVANLTEMKDSILMNVGVLGSAGMNPTKDVWFQN